MADARPVIFIFSYNRAGHLALCIRSACALAGECRIVVFDDASTEKATLELLDRLPEGVEVVRRASSAGLRHGGLYKNMQSAFEMAGDAPFMLFVQDDVQFVRKLTEVDYADLTALCDATPAAFVNTTFLRAKGVGDLALRLEETPRCYRSTNESLLTTRTYVDVMAVSPARLREVGWRFQEGELANARQASRLLAPLRYMVDPILMNAPRPTVYRGRQRPLLIRALERLYRYGTYQIRAMTPAEVAAMRARDPSRLPAADDFLETEGRRVPKPWDYDIFETSAYIYPLYYLTRSPLKYLRYQITKRVGGRAVDDFSL